MLAAVFTGFFSSCDYSAINVSPDSPATATLSSLLASSEISIAYTVGADISQLSNIFTQHLTGTVLQAAAWDRYNVDAEAGSPFNLFYAGPMQDLITLLRSAGETGATGYSGVSKILLAYSLGTMTSLYGDIPYSEAFQGASNPHPKFDRQEAIYEEIQKLLSEAITDLENAGPGTMPGSDDFIFQGNASKWIASAYSLKARHYLHLTEVDANAASKALEALYSGSTYRGISNGNNDCEVKFGTGVTEASPWSQQIIRRNDFRLGKVFISLLRTPTDDPRLVFYASPTANGSYSGSTAGLGNSTDSELGPFFRNPASTVQLISFSETKFIEAEARWRINPADEAIQQAMGEAIRASVNRVASSSLPASVVSAFVDSKLRQLEGNSTGMLGHIITQKYIALFTQPEVWTDWRRTGYPELEPAFGGTNGLNPGGLIPRRLPVPLNERLNNPNAPADEPSLQNPRFFWDR